MSRPIARPGALSAPGQIPRNGGPSRRSSAAKGSAPQQTQYLTAARLEALAESLSDSDRAVLRFVHDSRFATGHQLLRRIWHSSDQGSAVARAARRALKRLVDQRVLATLPRRIGGVRTGSQGLIYATGLAGARLLAVRGVSGPRVDLPGTLHLSHTLATTELVVRLGEAERSVGLEIIEVQQEPLCWRPFPGAGGAARVLKPDLFVRLGAGALEDRWIVEVDLGSESGRTLARKATLYRDHYRSGREQHAHGVYPRVLWTAPDDERAAQIRAVLDAQPEELTRLCSVRRFDEATDFLAKEAAA
jgi:Replication-relaxation